MGKDFLNLVDSLSIPNLSDIISKCPSKNAIGQQPLMGSHNAYRLKFKENSPSKSPPN
jgi:hypothetical protein